MANLFDTIRQNRSALGGQQAGVTEETGKLQSLLRAKSGRAVAGGDAAPSNLGEQAAVSQTNAQLGQIGQGLQIQQQSDDLAAHSQQQQAQQQRADIDQARRFATVQNQLKTNQLLSELSRDKATLNLDRDRARLEQASFLLAMQDKKYTDELQDVGRRRRLDDAAVFQKEMEEMAFGDSLALVKQKLGNNDVLSASDRDYKAALTGMSIDDAIKVAEIEMAAEAKASEMEREAAKSGATLSAKTANTQSMYQAGGQLVNTGIQAYDKYSDSKSQNKGPANG